MGHLPAQNSFSFCFSQYHVIWFNYCHCHDSDDAGADTDQSSDDEEDWTWTRRRPAGHRRNIGVSTDNESVASVSGALTRIHDKKSETPPPPYDPPPPYHLAIILGTINEAYVISEPVLV